MRSTPMEQEKSDAVGQRDTKFEKRVYLKDRIKLWTRKFTSLTPL